MEISWWKLWSFSTKDENLMDSTFSQSFSEFSWHSRASKRLFIILRDYIHIYIALLYFIFKEKWFYWMKWKPSSSFYNDLHVFMTVFIFNLLLRVYKIRVFFHKNFIVSREYVEPGKFPWRLHTLHNTDKQSSWLIQIILE